MNEPVIHFEHFSFRYSDGTTAANDVTLTIYKNESVGLIGHNGSGKTTLLMHIVGILEPNRRVIVGGVPVTRSTVKEIRRNVGYVFQDARDQLFMATVAEDAAFGPLAMGFQEEEAYMRAERALDAVGLHGFGNRISYHLSGGEMRRVSLATVLAMSPDIIVMDEPTSGLDPRAKRELAVLVRSLSCTKLIASHDIEFVRVCTDRVILLTRGKVAAQGPTREILDNHELLLANGL